MEDAAETIVPLRPGFDIQFRGFHRDQVSEHIEVLEDQLKLVTIDRNEAVQLNSDLRSLYDSTRQDLNEARQRLERIESSDTGLPAASQRVQNMLAMAEEEVQTLRDQARHEAEVIRGSAETEATQLVTEAERTANELHAECTRLLTELESRRDQLRREHTKQVSDLREREHRMRQGIRDAYKETMEAARRDADELLATTRQKCAQLDAETEQRRLDALEEIHRRRTELDRQQNNVLSILERAGESIDDSTTALRSQTTESDATEPGEPVRLPEQREDVQDQAEDRKPLAEHPEDLPTYTVPMHTNGNGNGADVAASPEPTDTAQRN